MCDTKKMLGPNAFKIMYVCIIIYIYIYIKSDEIAPSIITLSQTLFIYFNIAGDNLDYFNASLLPTFIHYMSSSKKKIYSLCERMHDAT